MIYSIAATKDATIYERSGSMNTGIDEILEIEKTVSSSSTTNIYNSRALIKFDLTEISKSVGGGLITSPKYYLTLRTSLAKDLEYQYGLEAFPISQSWDMGRGRTGVKARTDSGATKYIEDGVSWQYRDGRYYYGAIWPTGSSQLATGTTCSFSTTTGGAAWYTVSGSASQSFNYEETDVRMNVTDIVNNWLTSSIPNEGFIVMRSGSFQPGNTNEEKNGKPYGSLKFFSTDTHTVYQPRLEVFWKDHATAGALTAITITDNNIVDLKNSNGKYKKTDRIKMNLIAREKYPAKTYATESEAMTNYRLPAQSFWSVKDMLTEETVIPFDSQSTQISYDGDGSYFNIWMNQFYAERRYKFIFKSITGEYAYPTTERIYDNDYTFKVTR